jgi:L-ascorbate metabolism protein UlaG (beta-lactamase superfamily)
MKEEVLFMKIRWYGHACFQLTYTNGTRVVLDPFGDIGYPALDVEAEIVTVSHDHFDHNAVSVVKGNPQVIKEPGEYEIADIQIAAMPTYHDKAEGTERGNNMVYVFEGDGMRLAHLGDLGHELSDEQIHKLGKIDILLTPVGGHYTIDADTATLHVEKLKPKVVIPMHFKTPAIEFPIKGVELFLKYFPDYEIPNVNEIEIRPENFTKKSRIIVLNYE